MSREKILSPQEVEDEINGEDAAGYAAFGAIEDLIRRRDEQLIRSVKEGDAKVCDEFADANWKAWKKGADMLDQGGAIAAERCAAAIRGGGER